MTCFQAIDTNSLERIEVKVVIETSPLRDFNLQGKFVPLHRLAHVPTGNFRSYNEVAGDPVARRSRRQPKRGRQHRRLPGEVTQRGVQDHLVGAPDNEGDQADVRRLGKQAESDSLEDQGVGETEEAVRGR